ncbi:hypothetical protein [Halorubrum sp. HHNYT27]|uniref:hypothetical protein n=1 Tax=Halorubrum sp. HHNYT27 TaxID=3402275 RepID=UPI003EB76E96
MRRRELLASGTALLSVALAGCGHPPVVLDFEEATTETVAELVSTTPEPGSEAYEVVASARDNGSAIRRGRRELFDRTNAVRVDGRFYEVSETAITSSEVTVYTVTVEAAESNSTAGLREVAYEDLPETDREQLGPILAEGEPPDPDTAIGVDYGSAEEVGNDSVFVPERQYDVIVRDGRRYRVRVSSRTADEAEYRYAVTEVAPDVETFADRVRDRYLFALTGLSAAERAVVEEAIEGAYFDEDDAFRSVVDRLRSHAGVDVTDSYGTWLLTYEGVEYRAYAEW